MNIPKKCPSCAGELVVTELYCSGCKTGVRGSFHFSPLAALSAEDEGFLLTFLRAGGRIKAVEKELGISYPTVKARLRDLLAKLGPTVVPDLRPSQEEILARLKRGEIFTHEAVALLKNLDLQERS